MFSTDDIRLINIIRKIILINISNQRIEQECAILGSMASKSEKACEYSTILRIFCSQDHILSYKEFICLNKIIRTFMTYFIEILRMTSGDIYKTTRFSSFQTLRIRIHLKAKAKFWTRMWIKF